MKAWSAFLQQAADTASAPFHALLATVGVERTDVQLAALVLALAFGGALAVGEARASGFARRRATADGEVAVIFHNADGSATPRIRFRDAAGVERAFDSDLPMDAETVHVGAHVPVSYDPANPDDAREAATGPGLVRPVARYLGVALVCGLLWYALTPAPGF
jgi:hypothetical protein